MSDRAKRLELLMTDEDTRNLLDTLQSLDGCVVEPQAVGVTTRISIEPFFAAWLVHPRVRTIRYALGPRIELEAGQLSTIRADISPEGQRVTRAFWKTVRKMTLGEVFLVNPSTGELRGKASGVRAGIGAKSYWKHGGTLATVTSGVEFGFAEQRAP